MFLLRKRPTVSQPLTSRNRRNRQRRARPLPCFGEVPNDEIVSDYEYSKGATNDFSSVSAVLAPEFTLEWPQSNERIRGAKRFAQMNADYPAHGPWRFTVHRIVGSDSEAVSDVSVTDGVQSARAISFFTVAVGKITRLVEYWPEPYAGQPSAPGRTVGMKRGGGDGTLMMTQTNHATSLLKFVPSTNSKEHRVERRRHGSSQPLPRCLPVAREGPL
jgi:hypothetical protein